MVFLVLLAPIGILAFALLMEYLEQRLRSGVVSEDDVSEFLDHADADEVNTFVKEGWTRALSRFRIRNRANRPSRRSKRGRFSFRNSARNTVESSKDNPADRRVSGETADK